MILPRNSLPTVITEPFKNKVPSSTFTSDPCRIKFYSQELLFHRDDICSKLRQYSRRPSNTEKSVYEHAAKTILCQGHLCPLPLHVAPIDWNYDHALRMYPLPNVLILGDKASAYTITCKSTQVANPGCFASDFTFYSYDPSIKELELCALEIEEIQSSLRSDDTSAVRKKKKRKESRPTKKESKESNHQEPAGESLARTPKNRTSTNKKTPPTKPFDRTANQKGINSFFQAQPAEVSTSTDRKKLRLQRHSDSEEEGSDRDSDSAPGDGEEVQKREVRRVRDQLESEEEDEEDEEREGSEGEEEHQVVEVESKQTIKRRRLEESDEETAEVDEVLI